MSAKGRKPCKMKDWQEREREREGTREEMNATGINKRLCPAAPLVAGGRVAAPSRGIQDSDDLEFNQN